MKRARGRFKNSGKRYKFSFSIILVGGGGGREESASNMMDGCLIQHIRLDFLR